MEDENYNGQIVLMALKTFQSPVTVNTVVSRVAAETGLEARSIKEAVLETLNGGVRFGYVQRKSNKYFWEPVDVDNVTDTLLVTNKGDNHGYSDDDIHPPPKKYARTAKRASSPTEQPCDKVMSDANSTDEVANAVSAPPAAICTVPAESAVPSVYTRRTYRSRKAPIKRE